MVLLRCLNQPFVSAILPRLFLIMFRYSQTVLISITIQFLSNTVTKQDVLINDGSWLVFLALVIYIGLAVGCPSPHYTLLLTF